MGAMMVANPGEQRNKSGIKSPFRKQAAKQIGQPEGLEKDIGHPGISKRRGDEEIPSIAQDAAYESERANRRERTE